MTIPDEFADGCDVDIVDRFREILVRLQELSDLEAMRMKDPCWKYEQVWLMSREAVEGLPENPSFSDYIEAGAIFQGWQWVHHSEEELEVSE